MLVVGISGCQSSKVIKNPVILSIGDSITEGALKNFDSGPWYKNYNYFLDLDLKKLNYKPTFLGHGSYDSSAPRNEGHGGYCLGLIETNCNEVFTGKDKSILKNFDTYTNNIDYVDIVILQGGINDIGAKISGEKISNLEDSFDLLIKKTESKFSDVKIIVIPPFYDGERREIVFEVKKIREYLKKYEKRDNIIIIDSSEFDSSEVLSIDNIHPDEEGYIKISKTIIDEMTRRGWI